MRDFEWDQPLWAVIKANGRFAGSPCTSYEAARELANQEEGRQIFELTHTAKQFQVGEVYKCPSYMGSEFAVEVIDRTDKHVIFIEVEHPDAGPEAFWIEHDDQGNEILKVWDQGNHKIYLRSNSL